MPFSFQDNLGVEDDGCDLTLRGFAASSLPPVRGGGVVVARGDRGIVGSLQERFHCRAFMALERTRTRREQNVVAAFAEGEGGKGALVRGGIWGAFFKSRLSGSAGPRRFPQQSAVLFPVGMNIHAQV